MIKVIWTIVPGHCHSTSLKNTDSMKFDPCFSQEKIVNQQANRTFSYR